MDSNSAANPPVLPPLITPFSVPQPPVPGSGVGSIGPGTAEEWRNFLLWHDLRQRHEEFNRQMISQSDLAEANRQLAISNAALAEAGSRPTTDQDILYQFYLYAMAGNTSPTVLPGKVPKMIAAYKADLAKLG